MINILDIPGQHFAVYDRPRHEAALYGSQFLETLRRQDTEENRHILKGDYLERVVGFRKAASLCYATLNEINDVLNEEAARQVRMKRYIENLFSAAAQRANERYPPDFADREVPRDAAYYTLMRSGVAAIADAVGERYNWDNLSTELANGARLNERLPNDVLRGAVEILPSALLFREKRTELYFQLKAQGLDEKSMNHVRKAMPETLDLNSLGLAEGQELAVRQFLADYRNAGQDFSAAFERLSETLEIEPGEKDALGSRLRGIMRGSCYALSRSISSLEQGRVDESVLPSNYTSESFKFFLPIGAEWTGLGLAENEIDHVHLPNARHAIILKVDYLRGNPMPQAVAKHIGAETVTRWCETLPLLDPPMAISDEDLGRFVGYFLFGHGTTSENSTKYALGSIRESSWLYDLMEKAGTLAFEPSKKTYTSEGIFRYFAKWGKRLDRTYHWYQIPYKLLDLANYALECWKTGKSEAMAAGALHAWMDDRTKSVNVRGVHALMKPEYRDVIHEMAACVGMRLGSENPEHKKIRVYVLNPERVGFAPTPGLRSKKRRTGSDTTV